MRLSILPTCLAVQQAPYEVVAWPELDMLCCVVLLQEPQHIHHACGHGQHISGAIKCAGEGKDRLHRAAAAMSTYNSLLWQRWALLFAVHAHGCSTMHCRCVSTVPLSEIHNMCSDFTVLNFCHTCRPCLKHLVVTPTAHQMQQQRRQP